MNTILLSQLASPLLIFRFYSKSNILWISANNSLHMVLLWSLGMRDFAAGNEVQTKSNMHKWDTPITKERIPSRDRSTTNAHADI